MKRVEIKALFAEPERYTAEPVTICGWVRTLRSSKALGFIELNDGSYFSNLQVVFEEKVFGGSVPKNFFPAVEKGVRLAAEKGVLAGYPVVGLKATLLDGSYHPVDSSEMAFIMAAKLAYKAAMPEAGPVILEPIHTLKAHVPNDNTGDIMGDVTKRRGRVLGMEPDEDGLQTIIAEVPLAELANFTTFIRQTTQGRGWFTTEFARYEILPEMLVPAVVEQAKKLGNLDEGAED